MSEIKRVALNTLEPQKVNDKVIKKVCKTVRISVILPESNEGNCPEYNYKDQLAAVAKKKVKQNKDSNLENGLDTFGDNDDDVRRIALEMEAKYGSGVIKKKRKGRKDDYADIGMGYDESDSFIDNTDGYDEIIPQNVTTLHGGFYVNSGALVFKTDDEASSDVSSSGSSSSGTSSSSESEEEDKSKPKNRKRVLDTSADSDSDTANPVQKEKKPKVQSATHTMQQAIKKKLFSSNKIQVKKRRLLDPNKKTVKDLLREKRKDLNMTIPQELKIVEDNFEKESSKENKKPMNITSVTDAIESVLKQVVDDGESDKSRSKSPTEITTSVVLSQNKNDAAQAKEKDSKSILTRLEKEEVIKLPENLPTDIETIVTKLKDAALNYKGEGKKAFFTNDVNTLLLSLERKSKIISKSCKVKVYEHIAQYVNCTKDTLKRRARILDLEDNEKRLKILQDKLKDSINAIMPSLEENYELESQKILGKRFSKESENNEELKSLKMPRRKFQWNEETKKLLKDVLSVKKRCFSLEGKYKDALLEEQIVEFLRTQILPLWPDGWMHLNAIKKVLNSMQSSSKSSASTSINTMQNSPNSLASMNTPQHSNLSITPITNSKISLEKSEITNSITVTKVVNNSDINISDSITSTKSSEKTYVPVKESDNKNSTDMYKDIIHTTSQENSPIVEPIEMSSDMTTYAKKTEVFKPYIEESSHSQLKNIVSDLRKSQQKQNEMFKPYAEEITSDRAKLPNYNEKPQDSIEIAPKLLENERHIEHSYTEKEKPLSYSDNKEMQGTSSTFEKDTYALHTYARKDDRTYPDRDKHPRTYSEKDKYAYHTYSEKEKDKQSSYSHSDKDKEIPQTYPEVEKQNAHNYSELDKTNVQTTHFDKDKHTSHIYPDKEKYISDPYSQREKHTAHVYPDKDKHNLHSDISKHGSQTYSTKDKHSSHSDRDKYISHAYSQKEKHGSHSYSSKDKHVSHAYAEKDKHTSHSYSEKDKYSSQAYSEKDKYTPHAYSERDKHSSHAYSEKDKHSSHTYPEKDKHSSHAYPEKDKHSSHAYPEKDKHSSRAYSEKDKHSSHAYSGKDKHTSQSYSEKDKHSYLYPEKDKHTSQSYSEKDKHSYLYPEKDKHSHRAYSEGDKHVPHAYVEKDKHTYSDKSKHSLYANSEKDKHISRLYPDKDNHTYLDKGKHVSQTYSDKDKHSYSEKNKNVPSSYPVKEKHSTYLDKKFEDKVLHHVEKSVPLDKPLLGDKPANLSKTIEKPTDLSKFQMFKPYSDTSKSHLDLPSIDPNKYHKPKEDIYNRKLDVMKPSTPDSSSFSTKSYTSANDYISSRLKHSIGANFQVGNISNELIPTMDDNGVIVKNLQQNEKMTGEDKDHLDHVISKTTQCQGIKRKLLEPYSRSATEMNNPNYFPVASSKHPDYVTTSPLVNSRSEGDEQKQIQMVMENIKTLQKLSCSPVKNHNSSSSPVSVIAYNKNLTTSKTTSTPTTTSHNHSKNDMNSRGDFSGGFQEEFQKQFINSLQQMSTNVSSNQSSYNNGS